MNRVGTAAGHWLVDSSPNESSIYDDAVQKDDWKWHFVIRLHCYGLCTYKESTVDKRANF